MTQHFTAILKTNIYSVHLLFTGNEQHHSVKLHITTRSRSHYLSNANTDAHLLSSCGKLPLRLRWQAELVFPRHTISLVNGHFISCYLYFISFYTNYRFLSNCITLFHYLQFHSQSSDNHNYTTVLPVWFQLPTLKPKICAIKSALVVYDNPCTILI